MNGPRGKSLRPVLELAADGESFNALASALGEAGSPVDAHVSSSLRPFVLAALLEQPEVLRRGPALIVATDDRSARDLAADISAYLVAAPRAPLSLAWHRLPLAHRTAAASRRPPRRGARRAGLPDRELRRPASRGRERGRARRGGARPRASPRGARPEPGRGRRPLRRRRAARRSRLRARRPGRGARPVRGSRRDPRRLPCDRGAGGPRRALRRRDREHALVLDLHPALPRRRRAGRAGAGGRARLRAPRAGGARRPSRQRQRER